MISLKSTVDVLYNQVTRVYKMKKKNGVISVEVHMIPSIEKDFHFITI